MNNPRALSDEAIEFRRLLIDKFWPPNSACFGYVDSNVFVGECVICGAPIGVHFAYRAPRAVLHCHGGCTEAELAEWLGLEARP